MRAHVDNDDESLATLVAWLLVLAAILVAIFIGSGCGFDARIEQIEQDVAAIHAEVAIGGGGDSVTAWLYAAIAGAAVLYPVIWRPIRRRLNGK